MSFVRLENLNDFIQPSTTCVKPLDKKTPGLVAKVNDISLTDCLACNGCITSAETVLVQQQNYQELFKVINANKTSKAHKEVVVSLSLQSIVSLAHKYSMKAQEAAERVASFLISLGCHRVYDINLARHLSLVESHREFQQRRKETGAKLPIMTSVCPGWICYAEKTNGDLVIPYLSKVRSPQQIMGALLKRSSSDKEGRTRSDVYHVTLMPCFDKKLEASREDFKSYDGTCDVDCVLTPVELEEILDGEGVSLLDFDCRKLDLFEELGCELDQPLTSHRGSVSGGYAENILLAHFSDPNIDVEYLTLKNKDFIELRLKGRDLTGAPRVAIVNGFRNIQTVVQRLKRKNLKYDYIEIMACPSGCINGGAQCRPEANEDQQLSIKSKTELYSELPKVEIERDNHLYEKLKLREQMLYTEFHPIPKVQNLDVNW